ncbi:MAG: hypothetical protein ACI9VR_002453 [Cognaticolwellia sp.]|jgi:hypothetical protein
MSPCYTGGMSWLHPLRSRVSLPVWEKLQAFPGPTIRNTLPDRLPDLQVKAVLSHEVNEDQAALFQRRLLATDTMLREQDHPTAAVFRIALACRCEEILSAPGPRAARIRALADYYASLGAQLPYQDSALPTPGDLPVTWQDLEPGARLGRIAGPSVLGPVRVHLLDIEQPRFSAHLCQGRSLQKLAAEHGALAASSGGFFLYSEPDIAPPSQRGDPVGMLVSQGQIQVLPLLSRAALWSTKGGPLRIEHTTLSGLTLSQGEWNCTVAGHNDPSTLDRKPTLFNRAWGPVSLDGWGPSFAIVDRQVTSVTGGAQRIPLNGAVIALPKGHALPELGGLEIQAPWHNAMAGGPALLEDGRIEIERAPEDFAGTAPPITFSADETFDQNLLPRLGVGLRPDGSFVLACVDGRNLKHALGLTLHGLAELLQAQGCTQAMNLDGGSSKRLWVRGHGGVDLADTEMVTGAASGRVRPVRTALLWHGRDSG